MANNTAVESFKSVLSGKNAVVAGLLALVLSAGVVFYLWNQGPSYQVLFSGLSPQDSGGVIEKLRERNIPYRVDGGAISVPAESVYEVRMELAGEGLPQGGGIGFEIFDKSGFGVTEFVQKVNYRRALQGELGRTISQIKEVESARVHLAMPDKGIFLDDEKRARASIILKLRAGSKLNQSQVASIVNLVAGSIENLGAEDVTVVDTEGRMWTRPGDEQGLMALSNTQLEYKRSLERDLESRIESMLAKVVGDGKVVARVSAEVDTKHIERTEEKYDPDGQVVRSEQRNTEKNVGGSSVSGVPGVMSNMGENNNQGAASSPSRSQAQSEVVNYEINKVVSRVVEPVGAITRLSVSVLVDGSYTTVTAEDGTESREFVPRTSREIDQFSEMIKGAVGYSGDRGDVINVASAPFEADEFPAAEIEDEPAPLIPPHLLPSLIKYATAAIVAILAMFMVVRPLIKRMLAEKSSLDQLQAAMADVQVSDDPALEAGTTRKKKPNPHLDTISQMKQLARENPQQVAQVLKKWVKER